jgi:hypothetical protein
VFNLLHSFYEEMRVPVLRPGRGFLSISQSIVATKQHSNKETEVHSCNHKKNRYTNIAHTVLHVPDGTHRIAILK